MHSAVIHRCRKRHAFVVLITGNFFALTLDIAVVFRLGFHLLGDGLNNILEGKRNV